MNNPQAPKKRQRLTLSCSVCRSRKSKCDKLRPVCSGCVKANIAHQCHYEVPQWVNTTVTKNNNSKVVTSPMSKPVMRITKPTKVNENTNNLKFTLYKGPPTPTNTSSNEGSIRDNSPESEKFETEKEIDQVNSLLKKVKNLEERLAAYQNSSKNNSKILNNNSNNNLTKVGQKAIILESEYVNFANNYFSYLYESNSLNDLKALSHHAFIFRDPFLSNLYLKFYVDYSSIKHLIQKMYQNLQAKKIKTKVDDSYEPTTNTMTDEQRKEIETVIMHFSEKNEYATLIANILKSKNSQDDSRLRFRHEEAALEMVGKIKEPVLGNNILHIGSNDDELLKRILDMLPRIELLHYLWKMYSVYVFPFLAIFDLRSMSKRISSIFEGLNLEYIFEGGHEKMDLKRKITRINLKHKTDYGVISIFLICLRLAFLAIKFNINDVEIRCPIEDQMIQKRHDISEIKDAISSDFVELAYICLNQLNISNNTSVISLIALILLFAYTELREEGRTGLALNKNHLIFSNIMKTAFEIGLNKEWKHQNVLNFFFRVFNNHNDNSDQVKHHFQGLDEEIYHRRKLFHYLLILDVRTSIVNGKLLDVATDESYDIEFPNEINSKKYFDTWDFPKIKIIPDYVDDVKDTEESIISFEKIEKITLNNLKLEFSVNQILAKISKMFNNLKTPVQLVKIEQLINEIEQSLTKDELKEENFIDYKRDFIFENKNFDSKRITVGENYYKIIDFLQRITIFYNSKLTLFVLNFLSFQHYDSLINNPQRVNNSIFFFKKSLNAAFDLIKISKEFLIFNQDKLLIASDFTKIEENDSKGRCYGFKNFNFIILPTIDTMCYRGLIVIETLLLRLCHCVSIVDGLIKHTESSQFLLVTVNIEEYKQKRDIFQELYVKVYGFYYKLVKLLVEKFGKFYSHSFKETLTYQYFMVCFKNPETITEWNKKKCLDLDNNNTFVSATLNELIEFKDFIDAYIKFDEERYPDTVSDDLIEKNFGGEKMQMLGNEKRNFGTTILPGLTQAINNNDPNMLNNNLLWNLSKANSENSNENTDNVMKDNLLDDTLSMELASAFNIFVGDFFEAKNVNSNSNNNFSIPNNNSIQTPNSHNFRGYNQPVTRNLNESMTPSMTISMIQNPSQFVPPVNPVMMGAPMMGNPNSNFSNFATSPAMSTFNRPHLPPLNLNATAINNNNNINNNINKNNNNDNPTYSIP